MKRPKPRHPQAGSPIHQFDSASLNAMALRASYVGSAKHKFGAFGGQVGTPGVNPVTVERAKEQEPTPPFTTICPEKWNNRRPEIEATELLRQAIRNGQVGHPVADGLPKYVWARDPEDRSIVYEARRLTSPENGYKAYPLTDIQVRALRIEVL